MLSSTFLHQVIKLIFLNCW